MNDDFVSEDMDNLFVEYGDIMKNMRSLDENFSMPIFLTIVFTMAGLFGVATELHFMMTKSCHFWEKGKKAHLIKLAIELGECESNGEELKIIELRTKILTNDAYKEDPEFVKCIFEEIVSNRIDEENKQKEQTLREFELQKIRLKNETQKVVGPQTLPQTKLN
ncbi:uncharacterized protein TNCV_2461111 [Trichonephila clavipes]|nr:uncharacterized protein TNCV_2461111 [Trichonephila clavipes]